MKFALKRGFGPSSTRLLTVHGRKSGQPYSTPVNLVLRDASRYLVSPYGERSWVKNARANGKVTLSRGNSYETRHIVEVGGDDVVPILRQYYEENLVTRAYFEANVDSPDTAFEAEAKRHPVFRLI